MEIDSGQKTANNGLSPRGPLKAVESHPLLLDDSEDSSPGPSSFVNRPVWGNRADLPLSHAALAQPQPGLGRYNNTKNISHQQGSSPHPVYSGLTSRGHAYDAESIVDSSYAHGEDDQDAGNSTILETEYDDDQVSDDNVDDTTAELVAVVAHGMRSPHSSSTQRMPALAAPQPRTPIAFQIRSGSASQTPIPRSNRASSQASQRQGTMSPFGRSAIDARPIIRPPSAFAPVGGSGDDAGVLPDGPSIDLMVALHKMSEAELDRHIGASRIETKMESVASPLARDSAAKDELVNNRPTTPRIAPSANRGKVAEMIRALSQALFEALEDAAKARVTAVKERAKNHEAVEYMNQQHQTRESALRDLCHQHGIKEGEISRALLRAPVLDAEATKKKGDVKSTSKAVARSTTPALDVPVSESNSMAQARWNKDEVDTPSLPQSLQEAMLEDLEGAFGGSVRGDSPSVKSASIMSGNRERSPSVASFRTEVSNAPSAKSNGKLQADTSSADSSSSSPALPASPAKALTRPKVVRSVSSNSTGQRSASSGLGDWASGLMPWGASGTNRKAAASTASSNIKATSPGRHTVAEETLDADEQDPFETPTRSKLTTALPEEDFKTAAGKTTPSRHGRSYSTSGPRMDSPELSIKSSGRSGLGILGTLTWRRKKPSADAASNSSVTKEGAQVAAHSAEEFSDTIKARVEDLPPSSNLSASITADATISDGGVESTAETPKTGTGRPIAVRRISSNSMPIAIHEAIGSEPTSPLTERLQAQLGLPSGALPKPPHFKAIFLATRVMTPDPSSLLYDSGKKTSELIASLAMGLVGRARDEGKIVEEPSKSIGGRRTSGATPRPVSMAQARLTQTVEEQAKRVPSGSGPTPTAASKPASSTTFARAFGRYSRAPAKDSNGKPLEPNVTRLPDMYRFTAEAAPPPISSETADISAEGTLHDGISPKPPATVELEAIVPSEAAPPTLARKKRHKKSSTAKAPASKSSKPNGHRLDPLDEESSGDEFEVYGGKGVVPGYGGQLEESDEEEGAQLLTDRYGFIYDATPADIRLLRQARKAATPAPACLTGIRVGVRARGGTESQSDEDKEDPDLNEIDTEDEPMLTDVETSSQAVSMETTTDSTSTTESSGRPKKSKGILSLSHSKPVAEAASVSVTSYKSPVTESGGEMKLTPSILAGTRKLIKPTTSQTVRRLLSQLQDMHDTQQTTHKAKWDEFIQRRRERLSGSADSDYSQGMVGINRMGDSKAGKEDWRSFLTLCQAGIPLCYRAKIWAECSGANEVHEPGRYHELLDEHEGETNQCLTQIDLDVHRTMPTNIFFGGDGQGVPKLRRLLVAFSWYNPACGYCQGMNNLAATLLLTHATEEEAFWVLVCIIEKILPSEYYTSHLLVSQADQRVLIELVDELMPSLSARIASLGVDLPAVTFAWFLSLYTDCLPVETLFRVWDVMFVEGMVILFRVAIAILMMNEQELLATTSAAAFYGQVHSMTSRLFSVDKLIKLACEDLKPVIRYVVILEKRERHVADLTRELGLDTITP